MYLQKWINKTNISYIITSSKSGWPEYSRNFSFFENQSYLKEEKTIKDSCQTFKIYKTINEK